MKIALYLPEVFAPQEDGYNQGDISSIGELDDAAYEEILVSDNLDFVDDRDAFTDEIVKKIDPEALAKENPDVPLNLLIFNFIIQTYL